MMSVIIIDDEPLICNGLAKKIDWGSMGCSVVGTAYNGLEGKELFERECPDIVITDIRMPGLSGLDLAAYIRSHYPETITILLTGYNEFEYAREAIQHQVFDFLVKPADRKAIQQTINRAVSFLEQKKQKDVQHTQLQIAVHESTPLAKSGLFLRLIMNGNSELAELSYTMNELLLKPTKGQVLVFDLDPANEQYVTESDKMIYRFAARNILSETFEQHKCMTTMLELKERCVAVITFDPSVPSSIAEKRVLEAANEGLVNIHYYLKCQAFVGVGPLFLHANQLHQSFQLADKMLDNQLYWGASARKSWDEPVMMHVSGEVYQVDEQLYTAIGQGNVEAAMDGYRRISQDLSKLQDKGVVLHTALELVIQIAKIVRSLDAQAELPISFDTLKSCTTFQAVSDQLAQLIEQGCLRIRHKKELLSGGITDQAANYVQMNYYNPELSLQLVADELQISNSYLSRMFHREKSIPFTEYLLMIRVERAKKFMHDMPWLKNYEVAEKVGFVDGKYFGQVFKKYCQMTLAEYRKVGATAKPR